jgi:tetratricopeptide (TPR) repeat protein
MKFPIAYQLIKMASCLSVWICLSVPASAKTTFEQANDLYREKQYARAAEGYRQLIQKGEKHSAVYYNLGNSYYRMAEYPKAVLYFEKALKLDPGNDRIEHNLKMAYNKSLSKIESKNEFFVIKYISQFVREFGARTWSIVFLLFLWMSVAASLAGFRKPPGAGTMYKSLGVLCGLVAVLMFFVAKQRFTEQTTYRQAIVLQSGAELKAEPVAASKSKAVIEAGNKVELLDRDANWYKVELPTGKQGWVDSNALVKI